MMSTLKLLNAVLSLCSKSVNVSQALKVHAKLFSCKNCACVCACVGISKAQAAVRISNYERFPPRSCTSYTTVPPKTAKCRFVAWERTELAAKSHRAVSSYTCILATGSSCVEAESAPRNFRKWNVACTWKRTKKSMGTKTCVWHVHVRCCWAWAWSEPETSKYGLAS